MPRRAALLVVGILVAAVRLATAGEAPPPEPASYRLDDYRSPTPLTVAGQAALDTDAARRLWEAQGAVFIDVIAAPRRPDNLPNGAVWDPKPHLAIPGSLWLPDSGRGALSPALEAWLHERLSRISAEYGDATLVFYCRADCWMSWNAAKRALDWGLVKSQWFRDGVDGWTEAGLPLAEIRPPDDMPR